MSVRQDRKLARSWAKRSADHAIVKLSDELQSTREKYNKFLHVVGLLLGAEAAAAGRILAVARCFGG